MSVEPERQAEFLLARVEKRTLQRLAAALPARTMPDHLTLIGILGSILVAAGYLLSNRNEYWLLLACAGLAINWFGDSLDGTLARYRHIERPRYGFYLDHLTDAFSTIAIGAGLGLSPYMLLATGLTIAVAYLLLSINVYLETHVFRRFAFSYGAIGPTEVRILLILLNVAALILGPIAWPLFGLPLTIFDVAGLTIVGGMTLLLAARVAGNLRTLAALEPARRSTQGRTTQ
ncbi:MAG: CDP-alcohol phosphatidyltransferase family protein [Longimicrobiales bacterium]